MQEIIKNYKGENMLKTKDMIHISLMAALIAVCSWICLPASVPFTMQTFAVFCALLILGGKHGTLSIAMYLLIGLVGLPVFSGFRGGPGVLAGPTGGYLFGFLICGVIFRILEGRIHKYLLLAVSCFTYYLFGTVWFIYVSAGSGNPVSFAAALINCVVPFIVPDVAKAALAVIVSGKVKDKMM